MYIKIRHNILLQIKYLFNAKNLHVINIFKTVGCAAQPSPAVAPP